MTMDFYDVAMDEGLVIPARSIVTVDLDSTLADTEHRHHMIDRERGTDWAAYSRACVEDVLVEGVGILVRMLSANHDIWIASGRDAVALQETEEWLNASGVPFKGIELGPWQPEVDGIHHGQFKINQLRKIEEQTGQKVVLHIDDHPEVSVAMQEAGYPCVTVTPPFQIKELVEKGFDAR